MPKWNFINGLDNQVIESVDPRWVSALEVALTSQATPDQSGYHVNAGGVTKKGNFVSGSNHEMAITDTVTHGEEAVIVAALETFGREDPIEVIAFAGLGGGEIASPCGNCRDSIRQYADPNNLVIINAPREGGKAVLVPGRAYFKSDFIEVKETGELRFAAIKQAVLAEQSAYDIYSTKSSPKIYGAVIACENGSIFRGSFRGDVAYHPDLPISAAIANFRDGSDDPSRKSIREIVVASTGSIPDVMYKDRQHALELAEAMQSLNGRSGNPLPVYLVNMGNDGSMKIFKTDTNEWLPHRFSPKHLGLEGAMAGSYAKLF
ncbi:MAG: cytidine deaminase [Nanoarchaeota archaeon]